MGLLLAVLLALPSSPPVAAEESAPFMVESSLSVALTLTRSVPQVDGSSRIQEVRFTTKDLIALYVEQDPQLLRSVTSSSKLVIRRDILDVDYAESKTLILSGKQSVEVDDASTLPHQVPLDSSDDLAAIAVDSRVRNAGAQAAGELLSARRIGLGVLEWGNLATLGLHATVVGLENVSSELDMSRAGVRHGYRSSGRTSDVIGGLSEDDGTRYVVRGKLSLSAERFLP